MPFSAGMGLDFYIFLATCKKSKKSYIYIYFSDEAAHNQTARPRDDQADKKQTFHRTNTLQAGLINQVDNNCFWRGCFDPNLSTIASSPNFWVSSYMFWYSSFTFLRSSSEPKIILTCYAIQYFLSVICLSLHHYRGDNFTHLMLITAFLSFFSRRSVVAS